MCASGRRRQEGFATCSCKCNQKNQNAGQTFWTGVECHICGAKESDCSADAGLKLDKNNCRCVSVDAPVSKASDAAMKKAREDQEKTVEKVECSEESDGRHVRRE